MGPQHHVPVSDHGRNLSRSFRSISSSLRSRQFRSNGCSISVAHGHSRWRPLRQLRHLTSEVLIRARQWGHFSPPLVFSFSEDTPDCASASRPSSFFLRSRPFLNLSRSPRPASLIWSLVERLRTHSNVSETLPTPRTCSLPSGSFFNQMRSTL